jgi:DNA-directed RNA polymerase alpha subunit
MSPRTVKNQVLNEPIQLMSVSPEFKQMAQANGFTSIQDILNGSLDDLHKLPSSGYRILKELSDILEDNGLGNLLVD